MDLFGYISNVLSWDFVLLQGPPHDISRYFIICLLKVNEDHVQVLLLPILSINCRIKKITSMVDLPGMNPNWFWVTLVTFLKSMKKKFLAKISNKM